uniref:Uncharacterized protein n=1 Tax=Peronospora matthiolae TaxID=2874970 RepID=A0AAV1TAF0_9STRA
MTRKSGFPDSISQSALHVPRRFRDDRSMSWLLSEGEDIERNRTRRRASNGRTGKNKPRVFCHMRRSRAARDAELYYWQFERVDRPLCDVDINKYPYKLVRDGLLPEDELQGERQQYQRMLFQNCQQQWRQDGQKDGMVSSQDQQQQQSEFAKCFLECFDTDYVRTAAAALQGTKVVGELRVAACFGQTLLHPDTLSTSQKYYLNDLRDVCPRDVQTTWSNVCDDGSPLIFGLIDQLRQTEPVKTQVSALKLTVRCLSRPGSSPRVANLDYFRKGDEWVHVGSRAMSDVLAYHDISLDNCTSFRVKVYAEILGSTNAWWGSVHNLVLLDESKGDPFSTKASLVSCGRKDIAIDFVTVKNVSSVLEYRGLCFQLCAKQGCTFLKASLPTERVKKKQADKSFEYMVKRLLEILGQSL